MMGIMGMLRYIFLGERKTKSNFETLPSVEKIKRYANDNNVELVDIIDHPEVKDTFRVVVMFHGKPQLVVTQYAGLFSERNGDGQVGLIPATRDLPLFTHDHMAYKEIIRVIDSIKF